MLLNLSQLLICFRIFLSAQLALEIYYDQIVRNILLYQHLINICWYNNEY